MDAAAMKGVRAALACLLILGLVGCAPALEASESADKPLVFLGRQNLSGVTCVRFADREAKLLCLYCWVGTGDGGLQCVDAGDLPWTFRW